MFTKEAGMVFDSVDLSPSKYVTSLIYISTPLVFIFSLYGKLKSFRTLKNLRNKHIHIFLISHVLIYLLFFSIQSRKVDRWLLPILPIILLYAAFGIAYLKETIKPIAFLLVFSFIIGTYLHNPLLLLKQFNRHTPKSEAYIWMRDNLDPSLNKLVYTEEGLDPMNKLLGTRVIKMEVYATQSAQFFTPENTEGYEYVVISSRPIQNYKRVEVREKYPFYYDKWNDFENTLLDENKFRMLKQFVLPKPNLIPLSDVFIFENLHPISTNNL